MTLTATRTWSLSHRTLVLAFAALPAIALCLGACGSDEDPAGPAGAGGSAGSGGGSAAWACDADHAEWESCSDNKLQYCHIVSGMDPHFHWGMDCETLGYACQDDGAGDATCVDLAQSCTAGEFRCELNTAYNCIDGHMGIEACGTAKSCHEEATEAHCEEAGDECGGHGHIDGSTCHCDDGYVVDTNDPLSCVEAVSFPQLACDQFEQGTVEHRQVATAFAEVFSADTHAELDVPVEVTLADNQTSYIHFPVTETGEFVLFFDTAGVFETVLHRGDLTTGTAVSPPPSGGTPNGSCEPVLKEHWHVALAYDGDGSGPVPYVLAFRASAAQTVRFILKRHDE